jgi:uncharacterized protein
MGQWKGNHMTNLEIVKDMYQAFQQGDIARLLGHCHEDAVWTVPGNESIATAGTYKGKQQIGEFFQKVGASMHFDVFEPREFVVDSDNVAAFGTYTARVPGSSDSVTSEWCMRFTLRDGKVQKFQEYYDTGSVERVFERSLAARA